MYLCLKNLHVLLFIFLCLTASAVLAEEPVGTSASFHGPVGLQTYSLRNHIKKDWRAAFEFIKSQGFKEVEIGLLNHYGMTREELKAALEEYGLTAIGALDDFHFIKNNMDKAVEEANYFGLKYLGIAVVPHKSPLGAFAV